MGNISHLDTKSHSTNANVGTPGWSLGLHLVLGDVVDYAKWIAPQHGCTGNAERVHYPIPCSAANSRMHHDETRVHAPKATHTKTDHMYKKKTLLVEDSYPAVHTNVRSSPWQKKTQDNNPWLIPK